MKTSTRGGWDTCALCPRLCRPSCPVASGSTREAAVPAVIGQRLLDWTRGKLDPATAAEAATLCTDCGACQAHCHLDRPLPELLRRARAELTAAPPFEPLREIEGEGSIVAIEADERPFAEALARRLGVAVRRWPTGDRLAIDAIEHAEWKPHGEAIRAAVGGLDVVVCDGGVAKALTAAGVRFRWLHEAVPGLPTATSSCQAPGGPKPAACCGAGGPLRRHHPEDALRVGAFWLRRAEGSAPLADARCRGHLRDCGGDARDLLDILLEATS